MGVTGLLPHVKHASRQCSMSEFETKRVGVDGYPWIYKGAFSCALELYTKGDADGYVKFFMDRINMLLFYKCVPVVVFDGADLPLKEATNVDRTKHKLENRTKAWELYNQKKIKEATEYFAKSIDVTHEMAYKVIQALREKTIEFVVAPYEADAQLAFLSLIGNIDLIITEDSDLLAYGASKVMYKLERNGLGTLVESRLIRAQSQTGSDLTASGSNDIGRSVLTPTARSSQSSVRFDQLSHDQFIFVCVITGTDFFDGIHGLGIKKAVEFVRRYSTLERILHVLRNSGNYKVAPDFETKFRRACLIFKHQRVYDPYRKELVFFTPLDSSMDFLIGDEDIASDQDLSFLGPVMDPNIVRGIAEGKLHPITKLPHKAIVMAPSVGKKNNQFNSNRVVGNHPDQPRLSFTPNKLRAGPGLSKTGAISMGGDSDKQKREDGDRVSLPPQRGILKKQPHEKRIFKLAQLHELKMIKQKEKEAQQKAALAEKNSLTLLDAFVSQKPKARFDGIPENLNSESPTNSAKTAGGNGPDGNPFDIVASQKSNLNHAPCRDGEIGPSCPDKGIIISSQTPTDSPMKSKPAPGSKGLASAHKSPTTSKTLNPRRMSLVTPSSPDIEKRKTMDMISNFARGAKQASISKRTDLKRMHEPTIKSSQCARAGGHDMVMVPETPSDDERKKPLNVPRQSLLFLRNRFEETKEAIHEQAEPTSAETSQI